MGEDERGCEAAASKSAARGTLEERGSQLTAAAQRLWLVRPAPATLANSWASFA